MDYFQYNIMIDDKIREIEGFKPYYKWITFNIIRYLFKRL